MRLCNQQAPAGSAGAQLTRSTIHALITRVPYPHPCTGNGARAASRCASRASVNGSDSMTAEEEAIYQQFLNQKKQLRQDALDASKRRNKFDPMAATPDEAPPAAAPLDPPTQSTSTPAQDVIPPVAPRPVLRRPAPSPTPSLAAAPTQPRAVAPRETPAPRAASSSRAASTSKPAAAVPTTSTRRRVTIKRQSGRQLTSTHQREQAELAAASEEEEDDDEAQLHLDLDEDDDADDDVEFSNLGDDMDDLDLAALEAAAAEAMLDDDVPEAELLLETESDIPSSRSGSSGGSSFATRPDVSRSSLSKPSTLPPALTIAAPVSKPARTFTLPSAMPAASASKLRPVAAVPPPIPQQQKRVSAPTPAASAPVVTRPSPAASKPVVARPAPVSAARDGIDAEEDDEEEEDGLDWEALAVYDSFEKYVDEVSKDADSETPKQSLVASSAAAAASKAKLLREETATTQSAPITSATSKPQPPSTSAPTKPPASLNSQQAVKTPSATTSSASSSSSSLKAAQQLAGRLPSAAAAAAASGGIQQKLIPGSKAAKKDLKKEPQSTLDSQLDEMEELFKFFELVENNTATAAAKKLNRPAAPGTNDWSMGEGATSGSGIKEDDVDWSVVERAFLGEGWEAELMELESSAARSLEGATPEGESDSEAEADAAEPWADEVTNLLLGLVGIAHKRYLGTALLPTGVAEEDRAAAYWNAPFAVLVQDDSKAASLEYANKQALTLLGWDFMDVYEKTSFDMVDPDPDHQQEWLWAVSEVEAAERFEKFTVVPEMQIMGAGGKPFTAKDVLLFRIDSLEGDAIGQAIVFKDWST